MGWNITGDLDTYLTEAGDFLRADPIENTVPLGVIEALRANGVAAFGEGPLFGWWRSDAGVRGALLQTGAFPLLLSEMPDHAAAALADALADRGTVLPGVTGHPSTARAFADIWEKRTGSTGEVRMRQRLFRLERLEPPEPRPDGAPRVATAADHTLVLDWFAAFEEEASGGGPLNATLVDDRIGYGGVLLWEREDRPVAVAGRTRVVSGMARIGPVYTPPEHRRRGYGAVVTAALTQATLDAGASHVVLFTDLANPTSNGIYQRIGFRAVSDRLVLGFRTRA
ncbi:GNAT family N-acetyltransferase [Actinoallomurus acaciae]|uniref:GNAT family N-acetyltransferase n=1 Tax=Actinoallomurus acaciae TaxID=502577 RepID=A0ABV5YJD3_9ACTN